MKSLRQKEGVETKIGSKKSQLKSKRMVSAICQEDGSRKKTVIKSKRCLTKDKYHEGFIRRLKYREKNDTKLKQNNFKSIDKKVNIRIVVLAFAT